MKQIKYLLLFAAIFMANSVFAQNANQAKACMDKATAKISNLGGFTARFELSRPGAVGRTSGTISMVCSYKEDPAGPPAPNSFFTVVFGIILPKASIITGILANIYLVLIL